MINTHKTFQSKDGFSPLLCDECGRYPLIDGQIYGNIHLMNQTRLMVVKYLRKDLPLPPLMLPADLGGWMIALLLKWNGADFLLCGGLFPTVHNKHAPDSITVPMSMTLQFKGNVNFSTQHKFNFKKPIGNDRVGYEYHPLWVISSNMEEDWPIPSINVAVIRLCFNVEYSSEIMELETNQSEIVRQISLFNWPTPEMINTQRTFQSKNGFSPLLCNEWGCYPLIDWQIFANIDWEKRWKLITAKINQSGFLPLPPLMLPSDLGGWMIALFLKWNDSSLILCGGLFPDDHNELVPNSITISMSVAVQFKRKAVFSKQHKFNFKKPTGNNLDGYLYKTLWEISSDVDEDWPMPTMNVAVSPFYWREIDEVPGGTPDPNVPNQRETEQDPREKKISKKESFWRRIRFR